MALIYPLLAQVFLTIFVGVRLAATRVRLIKNREVKLLAIAASNEGWPLKAKLMGNNYANQFETPVLFYVLVFAAIHVGAQGVVMQVLAWTYVATRLLHHIVHTGKNNILLRFRAFIMGVVVLMVMALGVLLAAIS